MAISGTAGAGLVERIGAVDRRLNLRNGEIERFEAQYAPFGIFDLWARFVGQVEAEPQVRHCRDIVALALVGGGMSDQAADDLIAAQPPGENMRLRQIAARVLFAAFAPVDPGDAKKNADGSPGGGADPSGDTMQVSVSETSAA